jgi:hypothetical protein
MEIRNKMNNKRVFLVSAIVGTLLATCLVGNGFSTSPNLGEKVETRCGWFSNPTPGNAWLDDRHGEWLIGVQGGHQAEGDWPSFKPREWVKTNGHYGYGCACMKVSADHATSKVSRIITASAKPLATCRQDRSLKEPK